MFVENVRKLCIKAHIDDLDRVRYVTLPYQMHSTALSKNTTYDSSFIETSVHRNADRTYDRLRNVYIPNRTLGLSISEVARTRKTNVLDYEPGTIFKERAGWIGLKLRDHKILVLTGQHAYTVIPFDDCVPVRTFKSAKLALE